MGRFFALILAASMAAPATAEEQKAGSAAAAGPTLLDYQVKLQTVLKHDDGHWIWFHPRVAAMPGAGLGGQAAVVMTLQKHLEADDHYSGLSVMRSDDLGAHWTVPDARPELDWRTDPEGDTISVCDVTPGWHAATGKLLAIGTKIRYSKSGQILTDKPRSHEGAYTIHDPKTGTWAPWKMLDMPQSDSKFYLVAPGCTQWLVRDDGTLLLPVYFKGPSGEIYTSTVLHCGFDGTTLTYLGHGDEISVPSGRGCCEPSLVRYAGRYYLTLRADDRAYVTTGEDGLHFRPITPWRFDDEAELGSYNTQQHWLAHSDGLFLSYTRRGANNDHVIRHRAPLFLAQVDPEKLRVFRKTEKVLMPDRGATFGNFGAAPITRDESWVTDAEGMWGEARQRGAEGCVFVARVIWSKPNRLVVEPPEAAAACPPRTLAASQQQR